MPLVTETLLRWRPSQQSPDRYVVQRVMDDQDFDLDLATGERRNRIVRLIVNSPRGTRFTWGAASRLPFDHELVGPQDRRVIPVTGRVLDEGFRWDFTPNHVQVMPGSVAAPTLLTSGGDANTSGDDTTAAFTPTANALLVIGWGSGHATNTGVTHSFSNTHTGSGAWTSIPAPSAANLRRASQSYCQMGPSPGSGTVTNDYSNFQTRRAWIVAETTGHNNTTPASENNTGVSLVDNLTVSLVAIAAGNLAIAVVGSSGAASVTVGTDETELAEATSTGASEERVQMEYGTAVDLNWTGLGTATNRGVAIEYAASGNPRRPVTVMG